MKTLVEESEYIAVQATGLNTDFHIERLKCVLCLWFSKTVTLHSRVHKIEVKAGHSCWVPVVLKSAYAAVINTKLHYP